MENKDIKVSFDFDGTLGHNPKVIEYAKSLVDKGFDVWIVTARFETVEQYSKEFLMRYGIEDLQQEHLYLFEVAEYCGIPRNKIVFTNSSPKYLFFNGKDFLWHLDDDWQELYQIEKLTKTLPISVKKSSWKNKCERIIKQRLK